MKNQKNQTMKKEMEKMDEVTMLARNRKMMGMIMLILMLFKEEVKQNQKKKIRQKLAKNMLQHQIPQTMGNNLKKTKRNS